MSDVLVLGGGFAGVWSAAGVVRLCRESGVTQPDVRVTLIDAGDDIVIRPRLYEADPGSMRVSLDRVLGPIGVRRIAATVTTIDTTARVVIAVGRDAENLSLSYDRLIIATGSRVVRPSIAGAQYLFDVDTMPHAATLDAHLRLLPAAPHDGRYTAVVVGAGFTGLEVATELTERMRTIAGPDAEDQVRVVLVERADVVGPELGEGPRSHILAALETLGIELRTGVSLERVTASAVGLSDGTDIAARTTVWTAGMKASPLTSEIPGERDALGRLRVDEHLRVVGVADVYAAGDTAAARAEEGHAVMQSCQHAVPQGKFAGHNVAADILGLPQVAFAPDPYVTCLDLGPAGAVLTTGWERTVRQTGEEAKELKRSINAVWIYPPVDDADRILDWANHETTWPTADVAAAPVEAEKATASA
jgi:NADH:ubiquinone reductase (H+-translocating)